MGALNFPCHARSSGCCSHTTSCDLNTSHKSSRVQVSQCSNRRLCTWLENSFTCMPRAYNSQTVQWTAHDDKAALTRSSKQLLTNTACREGITRALLSVADKATNSPQGRIKENQKAAKSLALSVNLIGIQGQAYHSSERQLSFSSTQGQRSDMGRGC